MSDAKPYIKPWERTSQFTRENKELIFGKNSSSKEATDLMKYHPDEYHAMKKEWLADRGEVDTPVAVPFKKVPLTAEMMQLRAQTPYEVVKAFFAAESTGSKINPASIAKSDAEVYFQMQRAKDAWDGVPPREKPVQPAPKQDADAGKFPLGEEHARHIGQEKGFLVNMKEFEAINFGLAQRKIALEKAALLKQVAEEKSVLDAAAPIAEEPPAPEVVPE